MTNDSCAYHPASEATHVAMVATTTGRHVYRLCDDCADTHPTAVALRPRVDRPLRAAR